MNMRRCEIKMQSMIQELLPIIKGGHIEVLCSTVEIDICSKAIMCVNIALESKRAVTVILQDEL